MDNLTKTITFIKEALLEDPGNIDLRLKLGYAYIQQKQLEKAMAQFKIVLDSEPDNPQAITGMQLAENGGVIEVDQEEADLSDSSNSDNSTTDESSDSETETTLTDEELDALDYATREPVRVQNGATEDQERDSSELLFEKADITFDQVGGMTELKEEIRIGIVHPFANPEVFKKYGKKIGGGLLLYGPPGCGKTHIARATAGEISAMFLNITIEDILDMWQGQSEKRVHNLFEKARDYSPTVMFIDEVDALGAHRAKVNASASTLVNQLLTEMDGIHSDNTQIMVIGATNTPWAVDPAFRRPGRFDKVIFVPPPDDIARAEIFKIYLKDKPIERIDYIELAKRTPHFSGADISHVCDLAAEHVVREIIAGGKERAITMDDLIRVLKTVQPTTKEWFQTAKNYAKYADESGTYGKLMEYIRKHKLD
jgi:SpoVK/Ycf46/Vps4 family AAA+-type ATPase